MPERMNCSVYIIIILFQYERPTRIIVAKIDDRRGPYKRKLLILATEITSQEIEQ